MADTRISGLPDGGAAQPGDLVAATRGGRTFRVPLAASSSPSYRGQYSASATYALGEYVSDASVPPKFFVSRASGNTGNALSSATHWVEAAPGTVPSGGGLENATEIYNADVDTSSTSAVTALAPVLTIPAGRVWYLNFGRSQRSVGTGDIHGAWVPILTDDLLALNVWAAGDAVNSDNSMQVTSLFSLLRNAANAVQYIEHSASGFGFFPLRIRQS